MQKNLITISLLIIAISIGFYVFAFLPYESQRQRELEVWKQNVATSTNPTVLRDKCLKDVNAEWGGFIRDYMKSHNLPADVISDPTISGALKASDLDKNECYKRYPVK